MQKQISQLKVSFRFDPHHSDRRADIPRYIYKMVGTYISYSNFVFPHNIVSVKMVKDPNIGQL